MIERREAIRRRVVVVVVSVNEGKTLARGDVTRYRYGGRQAVLSRYHTSQKSAYQKKGSGSRSGRVAER
jgi:hypothetical protein